MKIHKYIVVIILFLIPFVVSAQEELNRYLQTAAENNPGLKAKFNEYLAALEVAPQTKGLPDPQIAFGYFIKPVETRVGPQKFKLSASQMFPWFGTLKARENVSVQMAKAKYEAFEEAKSKLFNEVRSTYFNLYFNNKAIEITHENILILETFRNLANIKVKAGMVSAVDEYRIAIEIGDLENQLAYLKDNYLAMEVMFNNLLNYENNESIEFPEILWTDNFPFTKKSALDSVLMNNHQLSVIDYQMEALSYKEKVSSKAGKPNFNIGVDYVIVGKGENNLAGTDALMFPMVGITIPLYRNKYKSMVQEVAYLETAKENEKADKSNVIEVLFENGWKDYSDADRRIDLYISQIELTGKSLKLLETDYETGNKNFEEILRMERKFLRYNLELEKARADKQAAVSFITYLMGK